MIRITFGMIVLNGEPFLRYNLRALYPFAHQIIVAEGAVPTAANIATPDGHSIDGTLKTLKDFQANEDTEKKLTVITAEMMGHPDGFWPGEKHEQSQAYAQYATGDYLWQIDADEFYHAGDMQTVIQMLNEDPGITAISFRMLTFWGDFNTLVDGWYLRRGANLFHRLFKWGKGHQYTNHRPPTVFDNEGRDTRKIKWLKCPLREGNPIFLYHYSLLFPRQVIEKCEYYSQVDWVKEAKAREWANDNFVKLRHPFAVHNVPGYPSWLEPFHGSHPEQALAMLQAVHDGKTGVSLRPMEDAARLLANPFYRLGRTGLKCLDYFSRPAFYLILLLKKMARPFKKYLVKR